jgi:nucleotide-binding universal stress UspA family protein
MAHSHHSNPGDPHTAVVHLVVEIGSLPRVAVQRAASVASSLGAALEIIGAASPGCRTWGGAGAAAARLREDLGSLELRIAPALHVRSGSVASVAIESARETRPAVVVLSPEAGATGAAAIAVASTLGVRVLVVREPRAAKPLLAATDMRHARFPVLAASCDLARRLGKAATFFHNEGEALEPAAHGEARLDRLQAIAASARIEADAIVVRSSGTLESILRLADLADADVVSIGARRQSWHARLGLAPGLPERLVDGCTCSVYVVPMEAS